MANQELHIVAFDVPYPPDYGGAIDVFYKIRALHRAGARIHLHCFIYGNRRQAPELADYCASVHYYRRLRSPWLQLDPRPFIVQSRKVDELAARLLEDDLPILFEGMHTCGFIGHPSFPGRRRLLRMHNIEWQYYRHLARLESRPLHRFYLNLEALKLRAFEPRVLRQASTVFAISLSDHRYLEAHTRNPVLLLPAFHGCENVDAAVGTGHYALFHGNLSVPDNERAARFLIEQVLPGLDFPLVVAGRGPSGRLQRLCAGNPRAELIANPSGALMEQLLRGAQIHLLYSFQPDGLKLKLLHALHRGRFVIANRIMTAGTGLEPLCRQADTPEEIRSAVHELCRQPFPAETIQERQRLLSTHFSDAKGAMLILDQLG